MVENLCLGQYSALILHQVAKQLVFGGAQVNRLPCTGHIVGVLVDFQVGDANNRVVFHLFAGTAQNGADASHDFLEAERLGDVIVTADGQAHDLVLGVVTSGEEQHRGVNAFLADAAGDGKSIDVRQHDVQHDEIRLHFFDNLNGFGTGSGGVYLESGEV